jgi:hypothetical protein
VELERLVVSFAEREVPLREVVEVLHGRGYTLLLLLLAIPFCTPLPLPGLSTPFGMVIALLGLRMALGQKPWLPDWLLDRRLPARFFPRLLSAARRLVKGLEWLLRPRWVEWMRQPWVKRGLGVMVMTSGLLLLLPLPVPMSNLFPALTVVLVSAAGLEEDGLVASAGVGCFGVTLIFYGVLGWGGAEAMQWWRSLLSNPV